MKLETRVERQASVVDILETRVQDTQQVVADLASKAAPRWVLPSFSSSRRMMAGRRGPAALLEPLPREKVQRHASISHEIVQNLDVPVLQMVEQLPNAIQFFATHLPVVAEPVIEVPKILPDRVPQRFVECRPLQQADQLVEVPTIVSYSSLQGIVEQIADNPVPRSGRGLGGGLHGLPPGQDSIAFGGAEHVAIPVPGGGLHVLPDPGGSRSSAVSREEAGQGVFRTFSPGEKSPNSAGSPSAELLGEVSSWTPAANEAHHVEAWWRCSSRIRPKTEFRQLFVEVLKVLSLVRGSTRGVRRSDAPVCWQAQDLGSEFWPRRACRFFLARRLPARPSVYLCTLCAHGCILTSLERRS